MTSRKPKKVLSLIVALTMLLTLLPATLGLAATEDIEAFVTRLYVEALDRQPEADGLAYWVNELETGNKTAAQVVGFILVDAPEFAARNLSDDEFMDVVYRAFLNREPDAAGKAFWMSKLDEGYSRRWVMSNMMTAPTQEFQDFCTANNIKVGSIGFTVDDLPPAVPDELEVEAVTAINLKQVAIEFNNELDAETAEDKDNYSVSDVTNGAVSVIEAELKSDEKTVVITIDKAADQQDKVDVTIEDVEDVNGDVISDTTIENVEFLDMTIPSALYAEVVGNDTIRVTFNEPIDDATVSKNDFEVEEGSLYIQDVVAANTIKTQYDIILYSELESGTISVLVDDVEDFAGFSILKRTFDVSVDEDSDGPEVVGYKDATKTGITLIFNEDIELVDGTATNFYHTNGNNSVDAAITSAEINGNELTLDFSTNNLPEGYAYVYVLKDSVKDLWDNKNDQQMIKVLVEVDETAPTVKELKVVAEDQITIEFSEEVDSNMAEDEDNYKLLDSDGEEVDLIKDITYASKKVTIDFTENLSGDYTIVVDNIEDASDNEMAASAVEFTVDDLTPPEFGSFSATLYNDGAQDQMVKINFGEKMATEGKYSVLDLEKYIIDGNALADLDCDVEIALVDGGKAVEITIPSTVDDADNGVDLTDGENKVEMARVADLAGNYTVALNGTVDLDAESNVKISKVEATALDTIKVTFDDKLADFDAEDLVITTDNTSVTNANDNKLTLSKRVISEDSDGNTVVTLTLATDLDYYAKSDVNAVYAYIVSEGSKNKYGETVLTTDNKVAADKIAPVLYDDGDSSTDYDYLTDNHDGTFEIRFSENIYATNNFLAGNDLVVKADNDVLVNGIDYQILTIDNTKAADGTDSDEIVFELLDDYATFDGEISIERADTVNYIKDTNDNKVADFSVEFEITTTN